MSITSSEQEALLLEHNLIKTHHPAYNIVMRDDKSYPYLFLSEGEFPRLVVHRGAHKAKGHYFGPYPNVASVRKVLNGLQKIFLIRHCHDAFFKSRKRPCLQYQINRCSAPCVGYIEKESYAQHVEDAAKVLAGKGNDIVNDLIKKMQLASDDLQYEKAGQYRDLLAAMQSLRSPQVAVTNQGDVDVITIESDRLQYCIVVVMVRHGYLLGHRAFFPKVGHEMASQSVLYQFMLQHYMAMDPDDNHPGLIVVDAIPKERAALVSLLSDHFNHKITIRVTGRSHVYQDWMLLAQKNVQQSLAQAISSQKSLFHRFEALAHDLQHDVIAERIDCFDISHFGGEGTVGACVSCGVNGPIKSAYRRYGVKGHTPGDDYAALKQVLTRHYKRVKRDDGVMPDIILIDGGKGQLSQMVSVCQELQLSEVTLMAIAKGPSRKAGFEIIHIAGKDKPVQLAPDSQALHLLQFVRDEAHRFAITGNRKRIDKRVVTSILEQIPGVGREKRLLLLQHFGGLQGVASATVKSLRKVPGIGPKLAQIIHDYLQSH